MSNKSPIFPMPEPQHFSDYGFDPQIDYFQVLEEARKHKRETTRSIDSIHFKLQKPISKDDLKKTHKVKKKRWWRSAFLFFKWKWTHINHHHHSHHGHGHGHDHDREDVHQARARAFRASISGPVYITESTSGSSTPYRTSTTTSEVDIPYLSLRELNMEQQQVQQQRFSASAMPIYLVT
nr:uncharacterized protein LOC112028235 isoform X3 [Quercus suber]